MQYHASNSRLREIFEYNLDLFVLLLLLLFCSFCLSCAMFTFLIALCHILIKRTTLCSLCMRSTSIPIRANCFILFVFVILVPTFFFFLLSSLKLDYLCNEQKPKYKTVTSRPFAYATKYIINGCSESKRTSEREYRKKWR